MPAFEHLPQKRSRDFGSLGEVGTLWYSNFNGRERYGKMMGNEVNKGRTMVGNEFEKVVVVN